MKSSRLSRELPLHLMILPSLAILVVFAYIPMAGLVMAFQKFTPARGFQDSPWIGFGNFVYLVSLPNAFRVLFNTAYIAFLKIVGRLAIAVTFSLLLNEVGSRAFKKGVQTVVYFPYFLSWVILGGILLDILSPSQGVVNQLLKSLGSKGIYFLGDDRWFPYVMVITDIWKEFGFVTVVCMAALTSVDPTQYEAAVMDGAGRWKQTLHVTLPGILPIIVLLATLSLGNILNAGFDQIFNLYSPAVYKSGDIIDTMVYRLGLVQAQFAVATAAGLFKSVVSGVFVTVSFWLADRVAGYRVI